MCGWESFQASLAIASATKNTPITALSVHFAWTKGTVLRFFLSMEA